MAVVAMEHMLAVYYDGKQIAVHRISGRKKEMVIQPQHYAEIRIKERKDVKNPLLEQGMEMDGFCPIRDLSRYDEALYG